MEKRQSNIVVLGAGLIGSFIADYLAEDTQLQVKVADRNQKQLNLIKQRSPRLDTSTADLSKDNELIKQVQGADVVVGALPGSLGYHCLKTIIPHVKNIVDISFLPEDTLKLNQLAQDHGCKVVVDMGLSPGINNVFVGHACAHHTFDEGVIYVGGLPQERKWPFEYQLVFSASDVVEEYTRPARMLQNGKVIVREALSDIEFINVPEFGTLEAFNTDGLRSLLHTSKIPTLCEKTMRYPGHAELMQTLRTAGFFDSEPLSVKGHQVTPKEITTALLTRAWMPTKNAKDWAILKIILKGKNQEATFELIDVQQTPDQPTAMARTTGLPCCMAVNWLLTKGDQLDTGVHPPENLGAIEGFFDQLVQILREHGVSINVTV